MNEAENKIVENIEKHVCHITSVFDNSGEEPSFTYSTGIQKSVNAPEVIVVGLPNKLAASEAFLKSTPIRQIIGFFGVLFLLTQVIGSNTSFTDSDALLAIVSVGLIVFLFIFLLVYFLTGREVILSKGATQHERIALSGLLAVIPSTLLVTLLPAFNFTDDNQYIDSIPTYKAEVKKTTCFLNFCTLELKDQNQALWQFSTLKFSGIKGDCYFFDVGEGRLGLIYMHNFYSCEEVKAFNGFKDV